MYGGGSSLQTSLTSLVRALQPGHREGNRSEEDRRACGSLAPQWMDKLQIALKSGLCKIRFFVFFFFNSHTFKYYAAF